MKYVTWYLFHICWTLISYVFHALGFQVDLGALWRAWDPWPTPGTMARPPQGMDTGWKLVLQGLAQLASEQPVSHDGC